MAKSKARYLAEIINASGNIRENRLEGIEVSAGADQTGAEIKAAYESETNAFTDAQFTKLGSLEALPTQTSQSGKFLTTNGSVASWADSSNIISSITVDSDKTLDGDTRYSTGNDLVIAAGATLTIPLNSLLELKLYGSNKQL